MAQVTLLINGYSYTVGCEDGQEGHLAAMAKQVEGRIDSLKALGGSSGESRLLVLATLLMADEIHDLHVEMDSLRSAKGLPPANPTPEKPDPELTRKLGRLAIRAEEIATRLEQP